MITSRSHVIDSDSENTTSKPCNKSIDQSKNQSNNNNANTISKVKKNIDSSKKKPKMVSSIIKNKPNVIEDINSYAFEVINEMKKLYKEDEKLMEQNKPAINKIKNVEKIVSKIIKKDVDEACIRLGILFEIKRWLEPLKDLSLPNPKIQKALLNLLFILPLNKNDLLNSGIGKILNFYYKNKHESKDIRKEARKIIKKWKEKIIKEEMDEYE